MGGYDPYSSSKGCAELVTAAYRQSFFNPLRHAEHRVALASVRAGNVIGGGDWAADRLIPDIVRAAEKGEEVLVRSPKAIRPWQHVLEPLSAYLLLAERLVTAGAEYAEAWNFGPNDEDTRPVEWIAREVTQRWGGNAGYRIAQSAASLHEAYYLKLDCSKARNRLGWQPRWSLSDALDRIIDWHKAMTAGQNMRDVTLRQIRAFAGR
jgi:CDP-glucose 4,6-dehydratase